MMSRESRTNKTPAVLKATRARGRNTNHNLIRGRKLTNTNRIAWRLRQYEFLPEPWLTRFPADPLALDHVHRNLNRQTAFGGFFVFGVHIASRFPHRADNLIE